MRTRSIAAAAAMVQCGAGSSPTGAAGPEPVETQRAVVATSAAAEGSPAAAAPRRSLSTTEARRYMVELINRDRASAGLPPVKLDEGAPSRAGQAHAEDMARHGYLGHWGTDGSVPEERFTAAGGAGMVMENASCFTDEKERTLDRTPGIDPKQVEDAEGMFFHEKPSNDGHRQNILKPWHTSVGIGVAQPVATKVEIPVPCFAQEFVDDYGSYGTLPAKLRPGDTLRVVGTVTSPANFAGVGLARIEAPRPLPVHELNQRRSYAVPTPYQTYWPVGFVTPIPVAVRGGSFSVDLPLSDGGRAGLYEVSVWASLPGTADLVMVSLRTLPVHR